MFAYNEQESFLELGERNDTHRLIDRQLQTAYEANMLLMQSEAGTTYCGCRDCITHSLHRKTLIDVVTIFELCPQQLNAQAHSMRRIAITYRSVSRNTGFNKQRLKWILLY